MQQSRLDFEDAVTKSASISLRLDEICDSLIAKQLYNDEPYLQSFAIFYSLGPSI